MEAGELDKVGLLAYFFARTGNQKTFSLADVASWFERAHFSAPNLSRLRTRLRESRDFRSNGNGSYALHARKFAELDSAWPELGSGGFHSPEQNFKTGHSAYVHADRITAFRGITNPKFDVTKLIRLCEELNDNAGRKNFYAVVMLSRAIIDHVPPIFGFSSFHEVANNYSGPRSLRESLQHLNNSLRKIADGHLHSHIRKSENLPTATQVDFSNDLDVLLGETAALLKTS